MVREKVGDVYVRRIKLDHRHARQIERKSVEMELLSVYVIGETVNIGNQSEQIYALYPNATHTGTYALILRNVDLADLWVCRNGGSTAYVHLIGTTKCDNKK